MLYAKTKKLNKLYKNCEYKNEFTIFLVIILGFVIATSNKCMTALLG